MSLPIDLPGEPSIAHSRGAPPDVEGERASLLHAAQNARSAAMLTGTHGVVAPPLDSALVRLPAPEDLLADDAPWERRAGEPETTALLRARAAAIGDDPVGQLRAQLELAHAELDDGREAEARRAAEIAAAAVDHAPAAHALLRVLSAGRSRAAIDAQSKYTAHVAEHVSDALVRADFLAEQGRLVEARAAYQNGGNGAGPVSSPTLDEDELRASAAAYEAALALVPDHAASLYGLEVALENSERFQELAALLGSLAGLAGEPNAAAWLQVERALVLDRRLSDLTTARAALDRALELAPAIGPVRQACVDYAVRHRDHAWLAPLLEGEAGLEKDPARATCLELDAAQAWLRAGHRARASEVLQRAHARPRTSKLVDSRIADDLAQLLEAERRPADVLRVRKAALTLATDSRGELLALRGVATAAESAGVVDDAILALERARVLDADDTTLLDELDRLLVSAGRHEARAVLWIREAALADDTRGKTRALLVAAEAASASGREADAARHREAAWLADPAAPGVFDALAERLGSASGDAAAVAARVALYEGAAQRTTDAGKRLYFLEKIAWLWDDVAGDPARAVRAYEDVLAIDPSRRSAIAGLGSAAARARDSRSLAKALLAEADLAPDDDARSEIRVRAAGALAALEPERALALAEELAVSGPAEVAQRARELVTYLHASGGRWELVARSFAGRAVAEKRKSVKLALVLAEAAVYMQRLGAPERALETLEGAREIAPGDPALALTIVAAQSMVGDAEALAAKLEALAMDATEPEARAAHLVRAAELAERRHDDDREAVRLYVLAREAMPAERLIAERLRRLGARAEVPRDYVPAALVAQRSLEVDATTIDAPALLAGAPNDFATLRTAERLARRAGSAPQLANALALEADATSGFLAMRALSGLAAVVAWRLPANDDLSPWDRLVALGSRDATVLDELVSRARPKVRAGDREALDLAIEATKRRLEGAADDTERLVLQVVLARFYEIAGSPREASDAATKALAVDGTSVAAAVVLATVARERGDRPAAIAAATALAGVVRSGRARSGLLRDAADLSFATKDAEGAAKLLERALEADPEAVLVAARLAEIQSKRGAWADLARVLRRSLREATTREAVVPMATELADVAKTKLRDPLLAIEALERSRAVAPDHVPALFLLAELFIGQRSWDAALVALGEAASRSTERSEKLVALAGRASILSRALSRFADAEKELRAALMLDPHDARALRALLALQVSLAPEERAQLLSRLVIAEPEPSARIAALLALAKLRRELGDTSGAEGAIVEAASLSPDAQMLERLRDIAGGDVEAAARVLRRALMRAREAGAVPGPDWLVRLGELELQLKRLDAAIEHFEEATELAPQNTGARVALARALVQRGAHEKAAATLAPLLDASGTASMEPAMLRLLDEALSGAGRQHQAFVARELRAFSGDLDPAAKASLDARRPLPAAHGESMSASVLRSFVMPGRFGKNAIWDAAAVAASLSGKLARVALTDQGSSTRERMKPRTVHPIRDLFDRLVRVFELTDIELAVSETAMAPLVACEDLTWLIVPSRLADWPEAHAVAALARPLTRIALGVPWLGVLPNEEALAAVVAVARQAAPAFTATPRDRIEPLLEDFELRARRAIDRKRRKQLEDLEGSLAQAPPMSVDGFTEAVLRTEARAAFLLSGDLRATVSAIAETDAPLLAALRTPGRDALNALFSRPIVRDLVAFALSGDATALRRSLGTLAS